MLRLNSCLWGDAEEIVQILWYTETAYDAAKVRLQREYGRDKRNIQARIDELREMKLPSIQFNSIQFTHTFLKIFTLYICLDL